MKLFINFIEYQKYNLMLLGHFALPFILFSLPLEWLKRQQSICIVKNIFGIECFGCGITKAIIAAIQLNFETALEYNKMVVIALPCLLYIWTKRTFSIYKKSTFCDLVTI